MNRSWTAMAAPKAEPSPSARLKYVALLFLVPALGLAYVSVSRAGDGGATRAAALAVFALGFVVGAAAGGWLMIKEGRRSDEDLRAGTGGAIGGSAAVAIVAVFFPYVFFGDKLPEIPDRFIAGLISGFTASAAIGLVVLGRVWRKRGF